MVRRLAFVCTLAAATFFLFADNAQACHRGGHGGGCCGCGGYYGGGGCCGYSSCGCGGYYGGGCGCCGYSSCGYGGCGYGGCGYQQSCGCCGYGGGYGGGYYGGGMMYGAPAQDQKDGKRDGRDGHGALDTGKADIIVSLPADATLKIDDEATASTGSTRVFSTPALDAGKAYTYTLTAQVNRDGKAVSFSREVTVAAGQQVKVTMEAPEAVASR